MVVIFQEKKVYVLHGLFISKTKMTKVAILLFLDSSFVQLETTCSCRWQVGWYLTWSVIQMTGSLETRLICKTLACHFRDLVGLLSIQK